MRERTSLGLGRGAGDVIGVVIASRLSRHTIDRGKIGATAGAIKPPWGVALSGVEWKAARSISKSVLPTKPNLAPGA